MDTDTFKNIMSRWASGISVITTAEDDNLYGFTANSLASVSIDPLLISMSVTRNLYTGQVIERTGVFTINILKESQREWGEVFAGMIPERKENRFDGINIEIAENGCPVLPDVMGWMACHVYQKIDVGASVLFLGEVTAGAWQDGSPLLYFNRAWGRFQAD